MSALALDLTGAETLWPDGTLSPGRLSMAEGRIVAGPVGREVDLTGYRLLPGIVDIHGDGFERHLAPRRGAMNETAEGLLAAEAEWAANGITTAVPAQFWSWEGGLRGAGFAARVLDAIRSVRPRLATSVIPQLRFEIAQIDDYADLLDCLARWEVAYLVFNDHLPHDRLAGGLQPPRLTGQALKAGRNPAEHLALMQDLHARRDEVGPALDRLCARLRAQGVRMGSHDDHDAAARAAWRARGVMIAEFPQTRSAAEAARADGSAIVLGAPNVVRGGSHAGNASARDLISEGLCDALASDYHYPSPRRAALALARDGLLPFARAWDLVSTGPARALGLTDRGALAPGLRADLVILDPADGRVCATLSGGQVTCLSGAIAARFIL
jgi:alpha-D-ribose 1-methylphosphonate 5-triphosphate diphosphatase